MDEIAQRIASLSLEKEVDIYIKDLEATYTVVGTMTLQELYACPEFAEDLARLTPVRNHALYIYRKNLIVLPNPHIPIRHIVDSFRGEGDGDILNMSWKDITTNGVFRVETQ